MLWLIFVFIGMLFCHVFDDYFLQGCLANLKQRVWWEKNVPEDMYKKDYIMGLICHSMSWSFMILLPLAITIFVTNANPLLWIFYGCAFAINAVIHVVVDDAKANKHKINLIQDQICHFIQINLTFLIFCILIIV